MLTLCKYVIFDFWCILILDANNQRSNVVERSCVFFFFFSVESKSYKFDMIKTFKLKIGGKKRKKKRKRK